MFVWEQVGGGVGGGAWVGKTSKACFRRGINDDSYKNVTKLIFPVLAHAHQFGSFKLM